MTIFKAIQDEAIAIANHVRTNYSKDLEGFLDNLDIGESHIETPTLGILVPGFLERPQIFKGCNIPPSCTTFKYDTTQDIEKSAEELGEYIQEIRGKNKERGFGNPRLIAIGRSEGGLVISYLIKYLEGHKKIGMVGTLATPHNGTYLAGLGYLTKACRQMFPGSGFLKKLNKTKSKGIKKIINIYGELDELAGDPQWHDDNVRNIKLPGIFGHANVLSSPEAWKHIEAYI
jgi:Putative serine esterase (DUF676)